MSHPNVRNSAFVSQPERDKVLITHGLLTLDILLQRALAVTLATRPTSRPATPACLVARGCSGLRTVSARAPARFRDCICIRSL